MPAKLIEGEPIAEKIKAEVIEAVKAMPSPPHLASILASENPGAKFYANSQQKACEEVGIKFTRRDLPESSSQEDIASIIDELNADDSVTGILLFMPVPEGVDGRALQQRISPEKDVEGMTPANLGKLFYGDFSIAPCTAKSAVTLLKSTGIELKGKETVVVGHSEIVGKPTLVMLLESVMESPTPTCCHIATQDLAFHTKRADVLIVAVGKAGLITGEMIKPGAVVIDIGINRVKKKGEKKARIVGDVDFDSAKEVAGMITPVPGGVGAVTTAILLQNTVTLAGRRWK